MTNGTIPERGETELVVEGQTYVLALPLRQLRALDKDISCGGILKAMAPGTQGVFGLSIDDVALMFRYGLIGGGNKLEDDAFEHLWDKMGLMAVINACDKLLAATLSGAVKEKPAADPPTAVAEPPA